MSDHENSPISSEEFLTLFGPEDRYAPHLFSRDERDDCSSCERYTGFVSNGKSDRLGRFIGDGVVDGEP